MSFFNIIAQTTESTVVAEYIPEASRSDSYQSEAELEQEFIRILAAQGYEYLDIQTETDLVDNLRKQIEQLNQYVFTDGEWEQFFSIALLTIMRVSQRKLGKFKQIISKCFIEITA